MIAKTLSGFPILDESYGGLFSNRSFLVCGPGNSGKTIMGLRFTQQGLQQNERCLYLSTMVASDLSICAASLGFDLTPAIDSGGLTLLEYESFIHGNGAPGLDMLPPEGFDQLREIIHANSIERVVLDTVLPWVSVKQPDRIAEQIFSFTRSFDRLGVTTMLTLPKPASNMSFRLKKSIEDVVPISIILNPEGGEATPASMQVVKYLGEKKLGGKIPYNIGTGEEITEEDLKNLKAEEVEKQAPVAEKPHEVEKKTVAPSRVEKTKSPKRPLFASIPTDRTSAASRRSFSVPEPEKVSRHEEARHEEARHEDERHKEAGKDERRSKASILPNRSPAESNKDYEDYTGEIKQSPSSVSSRELSDNASKPVPKVARLSSIWKPHPAPTGKDSDNS